MQTLRCCIFIVNHLYRLHNDASSDAAAVRCRPSFIFTMILMRALVMRTDVARLIVRIRAAGQPRMPEQFIRRNMAGPSQATVSRDEVVISGLSGRLPESDNIAEFRDNLMKGVDMASDDNRRWNPSKEEIGLTVIARNVLVNCCTCRQKSVCAARMCSSYTTSAGSH